MKILTFISLYILSICCLRCGAQTFYMATNDDSHVASIELTRDSCYVTLGYKNVNGNYGDNFLLVKVNAYGDTVFSKMYGNGSLMEGEQLVEDANGNLILFGLIDDKLLLINTDSVGNMQWNKTFDDTTGYLYFPSFCKMADGGFIMSAVTIHSYVMVIRTDSVGNVIWAKRYFVNPTSSKIVANADGGFLIAGNNSNACYIIKTDSAGHIIWNNEIANFKLGEGNSVLVNNDGSIVMTGGNKYNSTDYKTALFKMDNTGAPVWTTRYLSYLSDMGYGVTTTSDNGYIICGDAYDNTTSLYPFKVSLIKTDSTGTSTWAKQYNISAFNDAGYIIKSTPDSGCIVAGGKASFGIWNAPELFILKTDAFGISCITNSNLNLNQNSGTFTVTNSVIVDSSITIITDTVALQILIDPFTNTNCYSSTLLKEPLVLEKILIHPNPFHEKFYVTISEKGNPEFEITDITGKQISFNVSAFSDNVYEINVDNIKPGILILKSGVATSVSYRKIVLY